ALYCAPLFPVGPTFYREARSLITLRSEGVQVPSENVSILRVHFVNESFLAEVSYAFTPDPSGAESTEPKLRSDFAKEPPDAIRDHLHNLKSGNPLRAWYQGRSLVFESTAR